MSDKEFIDKLSQCDFFAGNRKNFYETAEKTSVLVCGTHKEPAPLVSIIITTYKRPQWLKIALDSALGQEGFDDYEVIIVDNEGESLDVETETSRLVCSYHDNKIVYYRNLPSVLYRADTAISLSRSKWFCIVHDDDFVSKDHLKRMTDILLERPDIGYLACSHQSFGTNDEASCWAQSRENVESPYSLVFYPAKSVCVGCWPGWLGALINREDYIDMGGMSLPFVTGIGDLIAIMKYMDRYNNVYCASMKFPTYFYRVSTAQQSAGGSEQWLRFYMAEYMFHKYLNKRYHPNSPSFWNYIASIIIHDKIKDNERRKIWLKGGSIDTALLEQLAGLPMRNGRGIRRWVGKRLLSFIRRRYIKAS